MGDPDEMTPEEWAELEAELAELERTDPEVRRAKEDYDRTVADILRRAEEGDDG